MSFTPYTNYATVLPILKPGHIIRIADKFYMVVTVRRNRKYIGSLAAQSTSYRFNSATNTAYVDMVGNLSLNRIVHLQYVAIDQVQSTTFYWGTQPLLSKDLAEPVLPNVAGISQPMEIDRWSYDETMNLYITTAGTQDFFFQIIEYEVVPYPGTPTANYLHIMANGQAIFVATQDVVAAIAQMNAIGLKPRASVS